MFDGIGDQRSLPLEGRVGEGVDLTEHRRTPTPAPSPQGGGEQESANPLDSERL